MVLLRMWTQDETEAEAWPDGRGVRRVKAKGDRKVSLKSLTCSHCGAPLPSSLKCEYCGTVYRADDQEAYGVFLNTLPKTHDDESVDIDDIESLGPIGIFKGLALFMAAIFSIVALYFVAYLTPEFLQWLGRFGH
jgi:hypothetical protein